MIWSIFFFRATMRFSAIFPPWKTRDSWPLFSIRPSRGLDTHHEQLILAADVMNSDIHWISQEDSLVEAAAHLQVQNFERLPVVDKDQKLVGLISDFEVILALLRGAPSSSVRRARPTSDLGRRAQDGLIMDSFVHLHSHSEYSLLDGASRLTDEKGKPGELLKRIAEMKMPALAITDHGNLYGAIEFYQAAKAVNVKPIIGCEMYIAPKSRHDRSSAKGQEDAYYHFTLLARDNEGYQNLIQLCSIGFLEGYYYKPRVDKEVLAKYGKGPDRALRLPQRGTRRGRFCAARKRTRCKVVEDYQGIFGKENYYLELMDHGIADQKRQNEKLLELSKKTGDSAGRHQRLPLPQKRRRGGA